MMNENEEKKHFFADCWMRFNNTENWHMMLMYGDMSMMMAFSGWWQPPFSTDTGYYYYIYVRGANVHMKYVPGEGPLNVNAITFTHGKHSIFTEYFFIISFP